MNRKNMTRNALVTSIISLLLCVSMLVGTTFAWFTDSETSAGNNIKSGTLNVEMYYADGTKSVPTDATGWTDASTGAIFNYDLWEPGYAEVRHIKIANEGTLALKYQLYIVANGEVSDLSDVIDVYFMDPATQVADRAALASVNPIGNLTSILAGMPQSTSGILKAKSEVAVTLALKMQETAGNEYQNLSIGTDFSVVLVATQVEAENDSYGPDYDGDAWHNAMKVTNEQDLQAAINAGETSIVLENDIDLTKAFEIPADAKIDLNLNGKTLSGPGVDAEGAKVHALVNNGTLTLVGGAVRSTGANGGSAIYNAKGAALTLRNITIVGAPQDANNKGAYPSYAINNYGSLVVNGADITSAHGAISVYGDTVVEDANVTVNGRGGSSHVFFIGGEGTDLVVNGGTYTHKGNIDGSLAYIQSGTTMTVNGGNFAASNGGYGLAALGSLTVNGGTFANSVEDWNGPISISGGTFAKKPVDKHIAAGYKAVKNANGSYTVLKGDAVANDDAALKDALANGKENIALGAGNFTMPATSGEVTITGSKDTVIAIEQPACNNVTLNGVTVVAGSYKGIQHSAKVVYENCTLKGSQFLYADHVVIKNCVIDLTETADYIWTYSAKNVEFIDCTFNTLGKAILMYHEGSDLVTNVSVKGCTFNATASEGKAAIEIGSSYAINGHYTLTTENNTVDSDFAGEWRVKNSATNNTTVNGVIYNYVADGLYKDEKGNYYVYNAAGLATLNDVFSSGAFGHDIWGKTFNIIADIDANGVTWNSVKLNTPNNDCNGFTWNGNGHTISNLTISGSGLFTSTANGKNSDVPATFKNLTFKNVVVNSGYHVGILWGQMYGDLLVENVHVTGSAITGTCNVGALVGRNGDEGASTITFKKCSVTNTKVSATGAGDPNGASAFLGSALTTAGGANVVVAFENCTQSGNTLSSAEGQVGGGIYAKWNASTNVTDVVNDF